MVVRNIYFRHSKMFVYVAVVIVKVNFNHLSKFLER